MPVPPASKPNLCGSGLSRKVKARLNRTGHQESMVAETVEMLNSLDSCHTARGGASSGCNALPRMPPNLAQEESQQMIRSAIKELGAPPRDLKPAVALRELCMAKCYDGERTDLVPLDVSKLALASDGNQPSSLHDLLGRDGSSFLEWFLHECVLNKKVAEDVRRSRNLRRVYNDPALRDFKTYLRLVKKLHAAGMVDFGLERIATIGLFAVGKKDGAQRLIADARESNCFFTPSDAVDLASGGTLGNMELPDGSELYVGVADLVSAFFHIECPVELRPYFCLQGIRARHLHITELNGVPVHSDQIVYPRLRIMPMGFSHALFFCQMVAQCRAAAVGLDATSNLRERRPVPSFERLSEKEVESELKKYDEEVDEVVEDDEPRTGKPETVSLKKSFNRHGSRRGILHTEYVDNLAAMSLDPRLTAHAQRSMSSSCRAAGLPTHDEETCTQILDLLGWTVNGVTGVIHGRNERRWRLRLGLQHIIERREASGHELEMVVGHFISLGVLRREVLSCLNAVYAFIRRYRNQRRRLWPSVLKELRWMKALIPLIRRNMRAKWSTRVVVVDASEWGGGVCAADIPREVVARAGRLSERWRFSKKSGYANDAGSGALRSLLDECRPDTVSSVFEEDHLENQVQNFPDLGKDIVCAKWKVVESRKWNFKESMPTLEGRAMVSGVRRQLQNSSCRGARLLALGDSMTVALAVAKGRSSKRGLCRVCRELGSHLLAADSTLTIRWLPSEANPADGPSRHWSHRPTIFDAEQLSGSTNSSGREPGGGDNSKSGESSASDVYAFLVAQHAERGFRYRTTGSSATSAGKEEKRKEGQGYQKHHERKSEEEGRHQVRDLKKTGYEGRAEEATDRGLWWEKEGCAPTECSGHGDERGLSHHLRRAEEVGKKCATTGVYAERVGRHSNSPDERVLLRGRQSRKGGPSHGCHPSLPKGLGSRPAEQATSRIAGPPGLASPGAIKVTPTAAGLCGRRDRVKDGASRIPPSRRGDLGRDVHVSQTRRVGGDTDETSDSSFPRSRRRDVVCGASSLRGAPLLEGRSVRRFNSFGSRAGQLPGSDLRRSEEVSAGERISGGRRLRGLRESVEGSSGVTRYSSDRVCTIPTPSQWSEQRYVVPFSGSEFSFQERTLVKFTKCKEIRKRRESPRTTLSSATSKADSPPKVSREHWPHPVAAVRCHLRPTDFSTAQRYLIIGSEIGALVTCVVKCGGVPIYYKTDFSQGAFSKNENRSLRGAITNGVVDAIILKPNGVGRNPFSKPSTPAQHRRRQHETRFMFSILREGAVRGLPVVLLANSASSLWKSSPALELQKMQGKIIHTHTCRWGFTWRRGISIFGLNVGLKRLERVCDHSSKCTVTGLPHSQPGLPSHVPRQCPHSFCNTLVLELRNAIMRLRAHTSIKMLTS